MDWKPEMFRWNNMSATILYPVRHCIIKHLQFLPLLPINSTVNLVNIASSTTNMGVVQIYAGMAIDTIVRVLHTICGGHQFLMK